MAHLSERHEIARKRRDQLIRERSLSLAQRTGYPESFSKALPVRRIASAEPPTIEMNVSDRKKYSDEDLLAAQLRCQERLRDAREKAVREKHQKRLEETERGQLQSELRAPSEAAAMASQRLRDRKEKERRLEEEEIDLLISQQTSSIRAMNIARMLSPRFEERVEFTPSISKHSAEDDRVVQLLTNSQVGTFYH